MYFLTSSSLRLAKTGFLSSGKEYFFCSELCWSFWNLGGDNSCLWKLIFRLVELIFFHLSNTPPSESYFLSSVNVFLKESSSPYGGDTFSVLWKPFSLIYSFFPQMETVTKISVNSFLGGRTFFLLAERDFLSSENCFLLFCASFLQVKTVRENSWNK